MTSNAELLTRRKNAVPQGVANATPVFAARAENAEIWDEDGKRYVDFAGGIAVLNVGHRHPKVIGAVEQQLQLYTHTAFQVMAYEPYIRLAERLNSLAPFAEAAKTLLLTTGAEAVENAIKIARAATGRRGVIAFSGAFHGRSMMTMALTGKVMPYKHGFGAMPGDIFRLPFPIDHYGIDSDRALASLAMLFASDIAPSDVAAIIFEPVQGEGGFHPLPSELAQKLRSLCDQHGILLIADEVQSGVARTGRMFGVEHLGIEPDLITIAKSLAGGFPLAGVIGRLSVMDQVKPGGLGGTFAGSPVACAAALAVLDVIAEENLLDRASAIGDRIRQRLITFEQANDKVPIGHIRGLGAMIAFDCLAERGSDQPDGAAAKALTARALQNGLVLLSCGIHGETIRLLMPITATDATIDEGLDILGRSLALANDEREAA